MSRALSTPIFQITVAGHDITSAAASRLLSLTVRDNAGEEADSFELELDNKEPYIPIPPPEAVVVVSLGYKETGLVRMGRFYINEVQLSANPGRTLRVHGESVNMLSEIRTTRSDAWNDTTLGDILTTIAARNGLTTAIDSELAGIPIEHLDQMARSDMHFVSQLAVENRAVAKVVEDILVFTRRGIATNISGDGVSNVAITPSDDVLSWDTMFQARGNNSVTISRSHDYDLGETTEEQAVMVEGARPTRTLARRAGNPDDAQQAARSEARRLNAARGRLTLELIGRPELLAEGMVTLSGFQDPVDGPWKIKYVEHTFDNSGFRSVLEGEFPEDEGRGGGGGQTDLTQTPAEGGGAVQPAP